MRVLSALPIRFLTLASTLASTIAVSSCATTTEAPRASLTATDERGAVIYRGAASWTVRATSKSREDVVAVPGLGEVIAVDDRRCRLVRAERGVVVGMSVWEATTPSRCLEVKADKVCFSAPTTFVREGASFTVSGCADRNDIFLSRIDGPVPATVGPRAFIERCVPVPSDNLKYFRVADISVDHNDQPRNGLRFRVSGDEFEVCFLVRERGSYRVLLEVEDPQPHEVVIEGAVDEL